MTDPRPALRASALLAVLLLGACRARETRREDEVVSAIVHGQYEAALTRARSLAEASPGDAAAQELVREAEVAFLLDQGRTAIFRGDLNQGLELLERARELAPDHRTVTTWIEKTHAQLALHYLDQAVTVTGPDHLDEAELAYERVLRHDPRNPEARDGLARVLLLKNYRGGMSKTYFDDGLSSFRQLQLDQARRAFQVSRQYKENDPASLRAGQVETMLAEERLAQARELERAGSYFAAYNEYRLVLLIEPDNADGRAGLDRMDRETRATRTLDEADMALRRGELDKAGQALEDAAVLTESQKDDILLLKSNIVEKRLEDQYQTARGLADDYRFPEAVEAFGALVNEAPDYKDAVLRKATLEEFIRLAEEFYAKALASSDDEVAEEYLRAIHPVIWPEYKDVVERLEAIQERRAAARAEQLEQESEPEPAQEPAAEGNPKP